ncbi:MAG: ABC transporter ATP-binding protein [Candidatus Heimdallarchaeota archaeon]|nr:ABC transporter ATP-binding protein [Candidatus Heimdallarchaeota archaeon]
MVPEPLISCSDLTKEYFSTKAVDDISISVESNAIGLLGPNGSGKTTFIKLLLGLIRPSSGTITMGVDIQNSRIVPDYPQLPRELTVDQWIETVEDFHGKNYLGVDVQSVFNLQGDWKIKNLSAGQTRKVALLPIFYGKPELFILDEPTNFLDVVSRQKVLGLLNDYRIESNAKLILATHQIDEMRAFCDEVIILNSGKVMQNVKIKQEKALTFSIHVSDHEKYSKLLNDREIEHKQFTQYGKEIFQIPSGVEFWNNLAEYEQSGGIVYSITSNDALTSAIEEMMT